MIIKETPGPINLLGDEDSGKGMRQGQGRQGPYLAGLADAVQIEPVRPANEQGEIPRGFHPVLELFRQDCRAPEFPVLVQSNYPRPCWNGRPDTFCFSLPEVPGTSGNRAVGRPDLNEINGANGRKALGVSLKPGLNPGRWAMANSDEVDAHFFDGCYWDRFRASPISLHSFSN